MPSGGLSPPDGEALGRGPESLPGSHLPLPPAAPEEGRDPPAPWAAGAGRGGPAQLPDSPCGGSVVTGSDAGTLGNSRGPPSCGDGRLPPTRRPWCLLQSDAPRHPCPALSTCLGSLGMWGPQWKAQDWVCWRVGFWRTSPFQARGPRLLVRKALRVPGYGLESQTPPAPLACAHSTVGARGCPRLRPLSLSRFQRRWGRWRGGAIARGWAERWELYLTGPLVVLSIRFN